MSASSSESVSPSIAPVYGDLIYIIDKDILITNTDGVIYSNGDLIYIFDEDLFAIKVNGMVYHSLTQ